MNNFSANKSEHVEYLCRVILSDLALKRRTKKTITKTLLKLINQCSDVPVIEDIDLPYGTTTLKFVNYTGILAEIIQKEFPQYYNKLQKLLILK